MFHCAAKVGDWGRWHEFQTGCVDATRVLAQAAASEGIDRFIHISSTSAYGHPAEGQAPIDESAPLGQNVWVLDYYTRSKVDCERSLWEMAEAGLPLTVIRPSWLFGERDRTTVPRLVREFRRGRVMIVGKGDNPLERGLRRGRGRCRHPGGARPGLAGRGLQHHQPGPDHPARVSRPVRRCASGPPRHPAGPLRARVHGRLSPGDSGPAAHEVSAAAGDAVWSLVTRALPGIQHRESPCPVGLATVRRLPREHRADAPVVSGPGGGAASVRRAGQN